MRTIDAAIEALLQNPQESVLAEVRGVVVEVRLPAERTADDPFREAGSWEGEGAEQLQAILSAARDAGGSKPPVTF